MNISQHQQALIDAYLRDELTEHTKQSFETALASDEIFKKAFIFQQNLAEAAALSSVKEAMEQARVDNLVDNKTTHPEFKMVQNSMEAAKINNRKHRQRQNIKRWLIRGAIAACILLTGYWVAWTKHLKKDVDKELLAVFDEIDWQSSNIYDKGKSYPLEEQDDSRLRSMTTPVEKPAIKPVTDDADREAAIKNKLNAIETAYREEGFDEALGLLEDLRRQLPSSSSLKPVLLYYQADLYVRKGNYIESAAILKLLTRKQSNIKDDARWLLGLLYLKTNEKAKAKKEFKILTKTSGKYKYKARQKLKKHYIF